MNKENIYYDINNEVKNEKKRRARRKRRNRLIFIYIIMILLIVAVSFDVMYIYSIKQKDILIDELTKENDALVYEIKNDYVTKQEAEILVSQAKEQGKMQASTGLESEGREQLKREIREKFENGDGLLKILEETYSENIVVPDNSGYYFFDIDDNLKKHDLDFDKFVYPVLNETTSKYEGIVDYIDDSVKVKRGIDVSKFQGKIDWEKVKDDDVDFVFLRCGYRGYETGKIVEDETFEDNIKACNELGIDVGCYFFTEAKTEAEGIEEAEFVLDLLNEYEVDVQLPIVIDVEQSSNPSRSRTKNVTPEERTKVVIAFCERIKEAGYEPMIYGNLKSHMRMTDIYQLEDYSKWFAYYRTPLRYPYKFDIWQYSSTGSVKGIKGEVDLNLMFIRE